MATSHIWLPWWQTCSLADLRAFLTGWRKATTMESCPFKKLANEEAVAWATWPPVPAKGKGGGDGGGVGMAGGSFGQRG